MSVEAAPETELREIFFFFFLSFFFFFSFFFFWRSNDNVPLNGAILIAIASILFFRPLRSNYIINEIFACRVSKRKEIVE